METTDNIEGTASSSSSIVPEFNLRWDEFRRVVVDSLWTLLTEESLTDCTLVRLSYFILIHIYFLFEKC